MANTDNKKKPVANGEYRSEKQLARIAEKKRTAQNAAVRKIAVRCVAAAVAVAVVVTGALVAHKAVLDNGALLRSRSAMETGNFTVSNAMMSYYVHEGCNAYVESLGGESKALAKGLDVNKSLKKQNYTGSKTYSWFDYFLNEAKGETEDMLIKLEGAKADGIELSAEELAAVKAEAAGLPVSKYGRGVRLEDIEKAMEYRALAEKYTRFIEDGITVTDEELEAYYEENKDDFLRADYLRYVIHYDLKKAEADDKDKETDEDKDEETVKYDRDRAAAKKLAEELKACTDKETLMTKIVELFEEESENLEDDLLIKGLTPSKGKELNDWAFDEETEVGSTRMDENAEAGYFTVYMLEKTAYRSETPVATVRRILLKKKVLESENDGEDEEKKETKYESDEDYEARAKALLDQYLAGDKTAEAFGKLADDNSADKKYAGGLYENIEAENMGSAIADWVYDEARKQGDAGMVLDDEQWNILYFDRLGEAAWRFEANESVYEKKLADAWAAVEDRDVTVIYHNNYMDSIPA